MIGFAKGKKSEPFPTKLLQICLNLLVFFLSQDSQSQIEAP